MSFAVDYSVGDLVRVITPTGAAQEGEQGTVLSIQRDREGTITALTILIDHDPAKTRGTVVFLREIERVQVNRSEELL